MRRLEESRFRQVGPVRVRRTRRAVRGKFARGQHLGELLEGLGLARQGVVPSRIPVPPLLRHQDSRQV
jgi:hypothetical protein